MEQNGTYLGNCTHQKNEKQGNNDTQALSMICLLQVKEGRQTTKEEGRKEVNRLTVYLLHYFLLLLL